MNSIKTDGFSWVYIYLRQNALVESPGSIGLRGLTLSWGGWGKFTPPYLLLPINPVKIAFNAGYDLTFSFYLFYTLCEVFMTIGAVLRKIRGVFT